ncbi:MAG: stage II sporulation protein P [Bacilli bacterium]|nr:stage II sporulation protein P [Bacilli bacterium]
MNKRFKKKLKLRKNISFFIKLFLIFLLILFMQNSKYLKQIIILKSNSYIKKNYLKNTSSASLSLNSINNKNDEIFVLKEEKNASPIIYIYNTHQTEKYLVKNESYKPTVMHASKYLNESFNKNDLPSIFENRSINEVLSQNGWSYGSSYKVSRYYIEDTYKNNNTLKYFFDIHRDAGSYEYTTFCSENKCYAKTLFLIGLENPSYLENQKFAEELNKRMNLKVKGISKGILQKQGKKVNGVYNQDFSPRSILIEVGGENNSMEEVYNTLNVLSEVLIDYIKEEINSGIK